jgi:hypothetical protein
VKRLMVSLLLAACAANVAYAANDKLASEESVRKLLEVTESRKRLDGMWQSDDGRMQTTMSQALGDRKLTDEQQKMLNDLRAKVVKIMKEEMSWEFMESFMIEVYTKSFTQEEIDGMLAFYATPAGRSLITKMPHVMQRSMEAMQERLAVIIPRIQELQKETLAQVSAAK